MPAPALIMPRRGLLRLLAGGGLLSAVARPAFAGDLRPGPASAGDPRLEVLWRCLASECPGYVYDPRLGEEMWSTPPLTAFEDLPDDWQCPRCGAGKAEFHGFPR